MLARVARGELRWRRSMSNDEFLRACHAGDLERAIRYLETNGDPEARDRHGLTGLMVAAETGQSQLIRLLIDHGAKLETATAEIWTPLMFAVTHGQIETTEILLAAGANPNAVNHRGWSPLLLATFNNKNAPALIALLLKAGAGVNHQNHAGVTALHFACLIGNPESVRVILAGGANPTLRVRGLLPAEIAGRAGWSEILSLLAP